MTKKDVKINSLLNNVKRAGECLDRKKRSTSDLFKNVLKSVTNRAFTKRKDNDNVQNDRRNSES